MTASKDTSRPSTAQHRLSVGANASSAPPVRTSFGRSHSHTLSLGSAGGPTHRVNRRKSSTFSPPANAAVLGAAVEIAVADGSVAINRRSSMSRAALGSLNDGPPPSSSSSTSCVPVGGLPHPVASVGSALVDGPSLSSFHGAERAKLPARRASDGTRLTKKERAATGELKCEHCGKAYKHGSCLNKHLWEHTPQWQYTSKLLISKHQQVQLLEAASVLVQMNTDGTATNDSDNSSSSPAASGSSEREEEEADDDLEDDDEDEGIISSVETTPPPAHAGSHGYRDGHGRHPSVASSSAYSRSYQSIFSDSAAAAASSAFSHSRHWSSSSANRPATANTSIAEGSLPDEYRHHHHHHIHIEGGSPPDAQDLAAAVGLLSCSYGTPKTGPLFSLVDNINLNNNDDDVPPVPPQPPKYAGAASFTSRPPHHHNHHHHHHRPWAQQQEDVDMHERDRVSDEEDEGVFGRMDA